MGKYEPLRRFLKTQNAKAVVMTFDEVERVLGFTLPASHRYRAWWSNNAFNNVMTNEWLAAGFKTEQVDIEGRKLVFRRVSAVPTAPKASESDGAKKPRRHPLFGWMKGTFTIAPGTDLTAPADPAWADIAEGKQLADEREDEQA